MAGITRSPGCVHPDWGADGGNALPEFIMQSREMLPMQSKSSWARLVGANTTPISGSEIVVRPVAQRRSWWRVSFIVEW